MSPQVDFCQPCLQRSTRLETFLSQPEDNTVYKAAWDPNVSFSQIALKDLGEAAAKVITEREEHFFATYPLVSTRPTPYREVVSIVGSIIGREIKVEQLEYRQAVQGFLKMVCGEKEVPWQTRDAAERLVKTGA